MGVGRCLSFVMATALFGLRVGYAAELPAQAEQNKKQKAAEPAVKHCDIAGSPGVLGPNGVCVRISGYIETGVGVGQIK